MFSLNGAVQTARSNETLSAERSHRLRRSVPRLCGGALPEGPSGCPVAAIDRDQSEGLHGARHGRGRAPTGLHRQGRQGRRRSAAAMTAASEAKISDQLYGGTGVIY